MGPNFSTRSLLAFAAIAATASCLSNSTNLPPSDGYVAIGTWGGDTAGLIVGDSSMHLHVGCTYGDVAGRVALNEAGEFDVTGNYLLRAYPVAVGPTMPARFVGKLVGNKLTITVTITDTVDNQVVVRGPVVVRYGDEPRLGPCPICRRPRTR